MSLDHALWIHGHSAEIEYPNRVASMIQKGYYVSVQGNPSTTNWLHFAVPTAAIVDNYRMRPITPQFLYRSDGGGSIDKVDVYDGEEIIATYENPAGDIDGWRWIRVGVNHDEIQSVKWGIGISIRLRFGRHGGQLEFKSAGCDFEYANRLGTQRLQIYTKKAPLEFPYRSNLPIDIPNESIERIVISLHGTGGNADFYLSNGLAAAKAAADAGVDNRAMENTLIIAPQFLGTKEYCRRIAPNILHWNGGRASSAESIEQDLNGNGVPDSGTLSSFTVMDTLLEQVCRRSLFPNLMSVVVAGHSNGGRFMSRYAATSRFEQEVATPRGIHVRYLVMGSGSYLYMDDRRLTFEDDTYLTAAHSDDWRDTIVNLEDFSSVCDVDVGKFNDWPWGLSDLWPYPAQVGKNQIQNQFGARDVHYIVGELDLSASFTECPERVQGQDTLAKTLLYFRHLEQFYESDLQHHLHVVPDVGHSGRREMMASQGLAAIFGPIT
ncbi:MAG: hypothetical protein LWX51_16340 [Deltaproteobacteria bacterium]|jgi:pimeloyl-ACP methyl ester carboxylesterase|nr:hypothetical protein [Deltaproteobacteria bacterium]